MLSDKKMLSQNVNNIVAYVWTLDFGWTLEICELLTLIFTGEEMWDIAYNIATYYIKGRSQGLNL